eukprot:TRINITY_DN2803_c0_g1_i4.p2 TRINITY_DN2803_c0_g1~~TRINITY_DN2803_c0_g1_i4.p2  ORF type:complete len:199 (-),score=65.03 TRINITY_DN2803_c0_g1_i4:619-1215(-)
MAANETDIFSNPLHKAHLPGIYISCLIEELKSSKRNLEVKINGEQNRVLLENVRPSYYREKSELHPLAYYDDAAKGNTMRFKSVNSNVLSFSSNPCRSAVEDVSIVQAPQPKLKEDPVVATLKKAIGEEAFGSVRDIFEHYSAYSGRMHYMDSYEYNKFMKENGFYTEQTPKIKIDLLFARNNKAKESKDLRNRSRLP